MEQLRPAVQLRVMRQVMVVGVWCPSSQASFAEVPSVEVCWVVLEKWAYPPALAGSLLALLVVVGA